MFMTQNPNKCTINGDIVQTNNLIMVFKKIIAYFKKVESSNFNNL